MGRYDTALNLYQRGLENLASTRQAGLGRPTSVDRFLAGITGSLERNQTYKAAEMAAKQQEQLASIRQAELERQKALDAQKAEEWEYGKSLRPLEEDKLKALIKFQNAQADKMAAPDLPAPPKAPNIEWGEGGQGYIWSPEKNAYAPAMDASGRPMRKYEAPRAPGGGGDREYDKSIIPGTAEWKRVKDYDFKVANLKGNIKDIDTVNKMLDNAEGLIKKAPGSYAGAATSSVLGGLGFSTEKTQANSSLKALQASLMMRMPRMEGPQSDLDVQLYREQAGRIADPTVPEGDKLAALNTIRNIVNKYKSNSEAELSSGGVDQPKALPPDIQAKVDKARSMGKSEEEIKKALQKMGY